VRDGAKRFPSPLRNPPLDPADFNPRLTTRLLVLQPTPFCNINCDYCYLPDRDHKGRMTLETVRAAVSRVIEDGLIGEELTIVWHAGEPLVVPPSYYDAAFTEIARILDGTCRVAHSIQTNGMLLDDAWCNLFERFDVRVGVSLDGPMEMHDRHRKTRGGRGTHAAVMTGIAALQRRSIRFHVIAVVTADTVDKAEEIYAFFSGEGITEVGFNFDETEGVNSCSSIAGSEDKHRRFIETMLVRSVASNGQYQVRELVSAFNVIAAGPRFYTCRGETTPDNAQAMPFAITSVAWDGDFSTFSPELLGQASSEFGNFVLGNVHACSYLGSTTSERFMRLWNQVQKGTAACRRSCAYFNYCGGGAPVNKLYENGDLASAETLYCRAMIQTPFNAVLEHLETAVRAKGV